MTTSPISSTLGSMSSLASIVYFSFVILTDSIILVSWLWCSIIFQLHVLHHRLHLLQLFHQLLMRTLHRILHMNVLLWNIHDSLDQGFLLLQDSLQSCHHRWELSVLRYHSIRGNYHHPFLGVIFRWFCMILLDQITIKSVRLLPFSFIMVNYPIFPINDHIFYFQMYYQYLFFLPKYPNIVSKK